MVMNKMKESDFEKIYEKRYFGESDFIDEKECT